MALSLDIFPPGQLAVEMSPEVLDVMFYWDRGGVQKYRGVSNASCGEGNMCRLRRVDTDFPQFELVVLEG